MRRTLGLIVFCLCGAAFAQEAAPSLADAAKKSREDKPRAKIVINEDNLKTRRSLFPDIKFDGEMNVDEIVNSVRDYRASHTAQEAEDELRAWFNYFDEMMLKLIRENNVISSRKQERYYDPERYSEDYREARQQASHDARTDEIDRRTTLKNGIMIGRLQQTLYQVRSGLARYNMKYDWLKVRNGNGIGSY